MELRKTNESINRSFDAEGQSQDRIDSVNYEIRDAEGEEKLKAILGIED